MSGWLVARNRPPFAAYASPGPSGKSVVAGASVRFDLTDATSKEGFSAGCANSTEESSPKKTTFKTRCRMGTLTPTPGNCSALSPTRRRGAREVGGVVDAAGALVLGDLRKRTQRTRAIDLAVRCVRRDKHLRR